MGATVIGVSGARSQPLRLQQGLGQDGQAVVMRSMDEDISGSTTGYVTPPATVRDSSNSASDLLGSATRGARAPPLALLSNK